MYMTIYSKILQRELTFTRPGSSFVYVDLNRRHGVLGNQICDGGELMGNTITYKGDDLDGFKKMCRNWYRAYTRKLKNDRFERNQ